MKIQLHPSRRQRGFTAVVFVLILLGIMTVLASVNTSNLLWLQQEVRLTEKRQLMRTNPAATNQVPHWLPKSGK